MEQANEQVDVTSQNPSSDSAATSPVDESPSNSTGSFSSESDNSSAYAEQLELLLLETAVARAGGPNTLQGRMLIREYQHAKQERLFERLAREQVVNNLASRYGVPKEKLVKFNDPQAMEAFAREYADLRKQTQVQQRTSAAVDVVPSGNGMPTGLERKSTVELLTMGFRQSRR